jgi:CRISPR-associated protein Cas1
MSDGGDAVPAATETTGGDDDEGETIPVRMLNEYVYCPRLFYIEHVDGEFHENVYTLEGTETHRRVHRAVEARTKTPRPH